MTQYLVLLKLKPTKVIDVINDLRSLPQRPSPGIDLRYVMNVFGTWDLAIWLDAEKSNQALDFIHKKLNHVPGVVNLYTVLAFPNRKPNREWEETYKDRTNARGRSQQERLKNFSSLVDL